MRPHDRNENFDANLTLKKSYKKGQEITHGKKSLRLFC